MSIANTMSPEFVLSGIKVVDFSRLLPGPWATQMMADFGAEVIKHYSGLFFGARCAEVLGDYGAGPNYTGGTPDSVVAPQSPPSCE